jgi:hypothetical protein
MSGGLFGERGLPVSAGSWIVFACGIGKPRLLILGRGMFREGQGLLCGSGLFSGSGSLSGAEALPGARRGIVFA